jgi:hypothetical protein
MTQNKNHKVILSRLILSTRSNFVLNQKAPTFGDRRTKRNRDRSTQKRKAITQASEDI